MVCVCLDFICTFVKSFLFLFYRKEEIARFIDSQEKGVEEFEAEREKLIFAHEEHNAELRRKYLADEVELEKKFDAALTKLMEKYAPSSFHASCSNS